MDAELVPDWKFWSLVVAVIALVLSQLPPIILWFKKAKLELELYSRIHITHKIGNPNIQIHMILRNTGGRNVRIKSIDIDIKKDGKLVDSLVGQNYMPDPLKTTSVLLTSFSLEPNDEWSNRVNFLNFFNRDEEKQYKDSEKLLVERIIELRKDLDETADNVRVEDKFVQPFINIFDRKFIWLAGEYTFDVNIKTANGDADVKKSFRFTLFETQSDELRDYINDFNIGAGICLDKKEHSGVIVPIEAKHT